MDAISYAYADKAHKRIKKIINDPDSTSGVVTVPSTIAVGETITIPAGRTAVLPNLEVDGTLVTNGTVFIPSGSTLTSEFITLQSPNGALWKVSVSNTGTIVVTEVV